MRIKIKNPKETELNHTLIGTGVPALLFILLAAALVYYAGGVTDAWKALNYFSYDFCEDSSFICRPIFFLFTTISPLVLISLFIASFRKKRRTPIFRSRFTHLSFKNTGVLLESNKRHKDVFLPYGQTALKLTVKAYNTQANHTRLRVISQVDFSFIPAEGKPINISLFPPCRVILFLCKILDKRRLFSQFSYTAQPAYPSRDNYNAAEDLRSKMDNYCKTGSFLGEPSLGERIFCLILGITALLLGAFIAVYLYQFLDMKPSTAFYFIGGCLLIALAGIRFVAKLAKGIYRDYKAASKNQCRF